MSTTRTMDKTRPEMDSEVWIYLLETAKHTRDHLMSKARRDPVERKIVEWLGDAIKGAEEDLEKRAPPGT